MPAIEVRSARPSDAELVRELSERAFAEYTPGAGPRTLGMALCPGARALIAERGGKPAGFAVVVIDRAGAHLDAIAVIERARGLGVGRALLAGAEAVAERAGAASLSLVTADSNLAALQLFLGAGYVLSERRARYYPRGQDAVLMQKRLGKRKNPT